MVELAAPLREEAEKTIAITLGAAEEKLWEIANVDLGKRAVKVPDQIAAIKTLAQLRGWNSPQKTEFEGKIGKRVILNVTYTREPRPEKTDSDAREER